MSTDWYTRLVLTVVAVCLVLLVVQGQRGDGGASVSEDGRYRLTVVPMARMAVRFDSETGAAWKAIFPELKVWTKIAETPAELLDRPPTPAAAPFEMKIEQRVEPAPPPAPAVPSQP